MNQEPKDQRIPIMMSASEVKAIDDWSFEHRIRTRAEAVRRLCVIGAECDKKKLDALEQLLNNAMGNILDAWIAMIDAIRENRIITIQEANYIANSIFNGRMDIGEARFSLTKMREVVAATMGADDTSEAINAAREEHIRMKSLGNMPDMRVTRDHTWELKEEDIQFLKRLSSPRRESRGPKESEARRRKSDDTTE
ncbi:hypothetical protein [Roseixanthobacter liquoris]|uniref:hypothetical protein n=1 Tax=Roseixanthobacter liquoris TaxID=3119921 RepID=UPI003727F5EE